MNDAFENSIRNKLNEADIPFDQDAWSKMESLLDAGDKNKRPVAWWWWLFLLPLLGGMGWWIIQSSTADKKAAGAVVAVQKTNETSALKGRGSDEITNSVKPNNETVNQPETQQPGASASPEHISDNKTINQTNEHLSGASASPENKSKNESTNQTNEHLTGASTSPENKSNNKTPDNHLPGKNITANGSNYRNIITASGKVTVADSSSGIQPYDINAVKTKTVNNVNVYTKIFHPAEIPLNTGVPPDSNKKIPRRKINSKGLYIGVTLGPDLNVAPSLNYGKVGFNAGVLAHYYFNSRWFITTGAIYSKKLYGATSKDYTAWSSGAAPYGLVKVNANCDVLDIPVNMNYTFLQVNNNTVSATLGLSNYFMLKEQYQYLYKYSPKWEKTVENQNQHYLAILNVGALYQHPAGRRLIIGVQPYAKIPLHGVGLGQVKLYSAGVSFQLNLVGKKR
jgi:Outer membrane protein beta-barrel domain